jgi:methyltransferase OMS1
MLQQRASAEEALKEMRNRDARRRIHMSSTTYLWGCCLFGFALSTYTMYTYMSYTRALEEYDNVDLPQNADVSSRWMDMSRNFDDEVELSERAMLLRRKRENLCREARGNVLEVSAGTGRNMDLYRLDPVLTRGENKVKSLVVNDLSEIMLYQARKKFDESQDKIGDERRKFKGPVQFVVGDASDKRVIKRPEGGFDTIVQTMGICSETNPVAFLKRLGELCRQPGEKSTGLDMEVVEKEARERLEELEQARDYGAVDPEQEQAGALAAEAGGDLGGKILLLEHGRSNLDFVNRILDNGAKMHADHYGCWWNKDIEQVIKDSGLIVERKRRYHFGTTYEYVLRPRPRGNAEKGSIRDGEGSLDNLGEGIKPKGWGGWFGRS